MTKLDKDRSAGFGPFKFPEWDSVQAGAGEHDDDNERKARGLPTKHSRSVGNDALFRAWKHENEGRFYPRDPFARGYEELRMLVARPVIWFFQKVIGLWRSGRVRLCMLDERGECICKRDLDKYGNKP